MPSPDLFGPLTGGASQRGSNTGPSYGGTGIVDQFGRTIPRTDDPAFQPPSDPLKSQGDVKSRARLIHREVPNVSVQAGWSITDIRSALLDLTAGIFDKPAQLQDAIAADSRVQSAMRSRSGGLLGAPIQFGVPDKYRNDPTAKKCCRVWERHWPQMSAEPALQDILETTSSLNFSYAQILWDADSKYWLPYLQSWNARYSYYHWLLRAHVVITLDGQVVVTPGDGHWILHAPYGQYRGWMRGGLRALAPWYLARAYALRDWARYCERHGFPMVLADTPFGADPNDISDFQSNLGGFGQENILQLPGSVDVNRYGKYDVRYLEPKDENWQAFKALIEQCNDEITLALLGQNLTSQVKEGSLAAARVHADVRQAILEADARALAKTLYVQVLRPFAALNFGDPDLAPTVKWDVRPEEDQKVRAETFAALGTGLYQMRQAGYRLKRPEKLFKKFGLQAGDIEIVDPMQVEAKLAQATGQVDETAGEGEDKKSSPKALSAKGKTGKGDTNLKPKGAKMPKPSMPSPDDKEDDQ